MKIIYNVVIFTFVLVVLYGIMGARERRDNFQVINKAIPIVKLSSYDNKVFSFEDIRNHDVAVIKFYASWCGYCRKEIPLLKKLKESKLAPIYGVAVSDKEEKLKELFEIYGNYLDYNAMDNSKSAMRMFNVMGLPVTFIVDKNLKIRYRLDGMMSEKDLEEKIIPAIKEIKEEMKNEQKF